MLFRSWKLIYLLDPGQPIPKPKLSDRFFDVDSEELKREQIERSECVEKLTSLRTQEMRKRDKILSRYRYKYTLIRIRFPDGHVLEGTFGCHEPFSAVMEFVEGYVFKIEPCLFSLRDHVTSSDFSDLSKTLHNLNLVPAAVLYFSWDPESFELAKEGSKIRYLQEIYETEAKCLTNK
ncbi:hypothetical protein AB6A40_009639 [Gnathostoma spinigerum]|uniref:UBX domain-containing protein n=1 Tax=Gnathostoma spinigerum TaxID=75299 RepID=A0ABD6ETS9_9BILA